MAYNSAPTKFVLIENARRDLITEKNRENLPPLLTVTLREEKVIKMRFATESFLQPRFAVVSRNPGSHTKVRPGLVVRGPARKAVVQKSGCGKLGAVKCRASQGSHKPVLPMVQFETIPRKCSPPVRVRWRFHASLA